MSLSFPTATHHSCRQGGKDINAKIEKVPKLDNFLVKFVNFSGEKVVLNVCYDRKSSAVFVYVEYINIWRRYQIT